MALIHHDLTGTQTDCPKPLSRKKLRSLMRQNHSSVTAKAIWHRWKRMSPHMRMALEREEKRLREAMEGKTLPDGTKARLTKTLTVQALDAAETPSIVTRLLGFFGNLLRKAERESARKGN